MAQVDIVGAKKCFGQIDVFEDLNIEIADGEFVALLGPSGCGKSTLLRCVAGLEDLTGGDILFDGQSVRDVAPSDRGAAMVFQSYALYPHKSVAENLGFALRIAGESSEVIASKVDEAAGILGIRDLLEKRPRQLSGGQRQRVAIGRAIVRDPRVFLFDEPLSNLDAELRARMRLELSQLHDSLGSTMIYVTHDQVEAMTMADRIVLLNGGRIHQIGSPQEVYDRPADTFVARFIGAPQMNLFAVPENSALRDDIQALIGSSAAAVAHIGLRPDDLSLGDGDVSLPARFTHSETLGRERMIYGTAQIDGAEAQDVSLTIRELPDGWDAPKVTISAPAGKAHFFGSDGGGGSHERRSPGKVVLVAGAGSGLGAGIARGLTERGHRVVGTCQPGHETARHDLAVMLPCDLRQPDGIAELVDQAVTRLGTLDALYCNAAVQGFCALEELSLAQWNETLAVNLTAPFLLAQAAAPHLRQSRGVAIFAASVHAERASSSRLAYAVSKSGLIALSRNLAAEFGTSGARSVALVLGPHHSPAMDEAASRFFPDKQPADALQSFADRQPMGRIGNAEEIAGTIDWLMSPAAGFVTGTALHLDGGMTSRLAVPPLPGDDSK